MQFLIDSGVYEGNEESAKRVRVLGEIDRVIFFSFMQFLIDSGVYEGKEESAKRVWVLELCFLLFAYR